MAVDLRDNILNAIKEFYHLQNKQCDMNKHLNLTFIYDIVSELKEKYPLIQVITYGDPSCDYKVQIIYGPFYLCTITPTVVKMEISYNWEKEFNNPELFRNQLISKCSIGLRRRSEECKNVYIELPAEYREKIVEKALDFKAEVSSVFSYDFEDNYSFNIVNKLEDFGDYSYMEVCTAIIKSLIETIIECLLDDSRYSKIIKATELLE